MVKQPNLVVGVDEVGRGPWAGPLTAAAVIWRSDYQVNGLKDSKQLDHGKRVKLSQIIRHKAMDIGIGWASVKEIDRYGLTKANRLAMLRALAPLDCRGLEIIVDGRVNYLKRSYRCKTIIKADSSVPAVAAASNVAKVARDTYMKQMAKLYPEYGFEQNVGYGTPAHQLCLSEHGLSPLHRLLFAPVQKLSLS